MRGIKKYGRREVAPDHRFYLTLHIVLFLSGVLISQIEGAAFTGLGISIAATGVCGWVIFFWVRSTEGFRERQEQFTQIGLRSAFPARSVPIRHEYEERFFRARERIDVLGFGLRAFREDFGSDVPTWVTRCRIRILLVDPAGSCAGESFAGLRDAEEANSPGSIAGDVAEFLQTFAAVKNTNPDRFDVRLFRNIPSVNVCRIDDELFWGPYLMGTQSRNTPTFLVGRSGALFAVLEDHFEQIWSSDDWSRAGYVLDGQTYRPDHLAGTGAR